MWCRISAIVVNMDSLYMNREYAINSWKHLFSNSYIEFFNQIHVEGRSNPFPIIYMYRYARAYSLRTNKTLSCYGPPNNFVQKLQSSHNLILMWPTLIVIHAHISQTQDLAYLLNHHLCLQSIIEHVHKGPVKICNHDD